MIYLTSNIVHRKLHNQVVLVETIQVYK